jgi:hypothetical protein
MRTPNGSATGSGQTSALRKPPHPNTSSVQSNGADPLQPVVRRGYTTPYLCATSSRYLIAVCSAA